MKRLVYRQNNEPITAFNPSYKYKYTNQIYKDGKWEFYNRYTGKFGARPIVWYCTKEDAEKFSPKDDEVAEMIEWDGIDEEGYKNVWRPPTYGNTKGK